MYHHRSYLKLLLLILFFLASRPAFAQEMSMPMHQHTAATSRNIFLAMMDSMMVKMDQVPKGKSPGSDFLQQMLPHHRGAITMAQYEIEHGKNSEIVQLAKSILAEQQSEIQQMNLLLKTPANMEMKDTLYQPAMSATMSTMMANLPQQSRLTGTDHAFAAVMLPHHLAAIDMARVVLRFSKDEQVLAFARLLISDEQIEIEQMSAYLKSK
jgi:uncharacterized protein (DUF305 family)